MKNGQIPKNKKLRNLVVSKPESHKLRRKIALEDKSKLSRKKKHSLFADTKLQADKIKQKKVGSVQ